GGSDGKGQLRHRQAALARHQPHTQGAERDGTPDTEAPLPDEQGTKGFFALSEVELVVADDVVETSTDQTEDHGPHGHVHDGALLPTHGGPSALAPQDRDDDPGEDAQGVEVDVEGPEGKGVDLRAGNGREGAAVLDHALRSC